MKSGFQMYFRLAARTFAPGRRSPARLTFRRAAVMAAFLPALFIVQAMHWLGFLLDDILFRGYKRIDIKQPLFIVGVPRSGTTFLHRLLAKDSGRFTTCTLWELIFAPSITERYCWLGLGKIDGLVGRPLQRLLHGVERLLLGQLDDIHGTSLRDPEEDYLALVPICACFLLTLPFPFEDGVWHLAYFDDRTPEADKRHIMQFYKRIIQRHLYVHGPDKQFLSKNPAFSPMVNGLRETFPDGKIVGCLRNPYQAIPSLLSSMTQGAEIFDNDLQGTAYRDQLFAMLTYFSDHLTATLPELPESRHDFVTMEALSRAPKATVARLYDRFGFEMTPAYAAHLEQEEQKARGYRSKHRYTLEQFNLTSEDIQNNLSFVFRQFGFDPHYPA